VTLTIELAAIEVGSSRKIVHDSASSEASRWADPWPALVRAFLFTNEFFRLD
jgi:hypothetical protein